MEIKELMAQLTDILEEKGNTEIGVTIYGNEHDIRVVKLYPGTNIEKYTLEVVR